MFILAQIVNLELIQKSEPGWLTPGNIISISVAIIAASAVIYNARKTNETMRNNNRDSIKANLIENARVEWIQTVRILVSELIVILEKFRFDIEITRDDILNFAYEAKNKINLIQLYLGPDTLVTSTEISKNDIYNEESNKGKNDLIYKSLETLKSDLDNLILSIVNDSAIDGNVLYSLDSFFSDDKKESFISFASMFKNTFRIYFKVEWKEVKKVKKGKQ